MRFQYSKLWWAFASAILFLTATSLPAQAPVLAPGMPAGMQRGTTLEIVLTGKNLTEPTGLLTTFPGKIIIPQDKDNGKDAAKLRVQLEVPADAPVGWHALRVATKNGMSNAQIFCIDDLPQVLADGKNHEKNSAQAVPIPCAVAGRVTNLRSNYYKITVAAGQKLSFDVQGRRLGTPLDPELSIWSVKTGRELAHTANSPGLQNDAHLTYTFKEAGDYLIQIKDVLNRGGSDYVYRLRIGEFPNAMAPIPLAAQRGSKVSVQFAGRGAKDIPPVEVAVPDDPAQEVLWIAPAKSNGWPVALMLSDLKEEVEREPNQEQGNRVPVPGAITGVFQEYADIDRFLFTGKKGQKLTLQAYSTQFYSPALVYMVIRDSKGKQLAKSNPAANPPADQLLEFTPPEDGDYIAELQHLNYEGGPDQVYRLTITPPMADFQLAVGADRWDIAPGEARLLPIQVERKGHSGPIDIEVESTHPGITGKLTIAANSNSGHLILQAKEDVPFGPYPIQLRGTAAANGRTVTRYVSAGEALSDALAGLPLPPPHLRTQLAVAVMPKPPFQLHAALTSPEALPGGKTDVKITIKREAGFDGEINLLPPHGFPGNLNFPKLKPISKGQNSLAFTLPVDPKAPLGETALQFIGQAKAKDGVQTAYTAPVQFAVTRPFALQVEPVQVQLKPGEKAKIKITAARKAGYNGPITLQVRNLPANVQAAAATIAEGKTDAEIEITAQNNATGERSDVNILGTAPAAGNQQEASPNFVVRIEKK